MANEPRKVFEDGSGVVIGQVGADGNGNLVVEGLTAQQVQSKADLTDGEPGIYEIQDTGEVLYFDGDTSTN